MGMVPQSHALPVLVTRPEPQASRFGQALRDRYADRVLPILTPLMAPVFLCPPLPEGRFGSVVFTSETGVQAAVRLADGLLPRRAYCVGDRTAQVAQELGFQAISATGDADCLFSLMRERPDHGPFLHLRGREARGDLTDRLTAAGIPAQAVVVYAQEERPLTPEAANLLSGVGPVIVPLFSPRSAGMFRRALGALPQAEEALSRLRLVALSPAVAAVFADDHVPNLRIAAKPNQAELFLALDRFIFVA